MDHRQRHQVHLEVLAGADDTPGDEEQAIHGVPPADRDRRNDSTRSWNNTFGCSSTSNRTIGRCCCLHLGLSSLRLSSTWPPPNIARQTKQSWVSRSTHNEGYWVAVPDAWPQLATGGSIRSWHHPSSAVLGHLCLCLPPEAAAESRCHVCPNQPCVLPRSVSVASTRLVGSLLDGREPCCHPPTLQEYISTCRMQPAAHSLQHATRPGIHSAFLLATILLAAGRRLGGGGMPLGISVASCPTLTSLIALCPFPVLPRAS